MFPNIILLLDVNPLFTHEYKLDSPTKKKRVIYFLFTVHNILTNKNDTEKRISNHFFFFWGQISLI